MGRGLGPYQWFWRSINPSSHLVLLVVRESQPEIIFLRARIAIKEAHWEPGIERRCFVDGVDIFLCKLDSQSVGHSSNMLDRVYTDNWEYIGRLMKQVSQCLSLISIATQCKNSALTMACRVVFFSFAIFSRASQTATSGGAS